GHAYFGGAADPVALLKKHVSRVAHVHCKDVRPQVVNQARNDGWSFLNGVINGTFTVPLITPFRKLQPSLRAWLTTCGRTSLQCTCATRDTCFFSSATGSA
ncbi:hypothetical protein QM306_39150, partial [Burkholderia cenocepacia]|nr:hypothetical protein [Burkholderia cenocepacia]